MVAKSALRRGCSCQGLKDEKEPAIRRTCKESVETKSQGGRGLQTWGQKGVNLLEHSVDGRKYSVRL